MDRTPRRVTDAGGRLTAAEARSLETLALGLASADPRFAVRFQRFGLRGRASRVASTLLFLVLSTTLLVPMAMITPILLLAFGAPVCVLVGALVSRLFCGPGVRR